VINYVVFNFVYMTSRPPMIALQNTPKFLSRSFRRSNTLPHAVVGWQRTTEQFPLHI